VLAEQKNDLPAVAKAANKVLDQYSGTVYGTFAALALAKVELVQGDYDKAERALERAVSNAPDAGVASIVRLRLARVQLQQKKPKAVLTTLDSKKMAPSFEMAANTLR